MLIEESKYEEKKDEIAEESPFMNMANDLDAKLSSHIKRLSSSLKQIRPSNEEVKAEVIFSDDTCIRGIPWSVLKYGTDDDNFEGAEWFREYSFKERALVRKLRRFQREQGDMEELIPHVQRQSRRLSLGLHDTMLTVIHDQAPNDARIAYEGERLGADVEPLLSQAGDEENQRLINRRSIPIVSVGERLINNTQHSQESPKNQNALVDGFDKENIDR